MEKIPYDKYYTPPTVARYCIEKVKEVIGEENITEWIEPSAGSGVFNYQIDGCKAYDLYPQGPDIEQIDFLKLDLGGYKKGRIFIGNPPFGGSSGALLSKFFKKCSKEGDYIAFILPSSYYNNYGKFYNYEIIHSSMIETEYTNRTLRTAFVIYKRNTDKDDWRNDYKLEDVIIRSYIRKNKGSKGSLIKKVVNDYDYAFINFGDIFKETRPYQYASCLTIKCNNPDNKEEILSFLKWVYYYRKNNIGFINSIGSQSISSNIVKRLLILCIDGIK